MNSMDVQVNGDPLESELVGSTDTAAVPLSIHINGDDPAQVGAFEPPTNIHHEADMSDSNLSENEDQDHKPTGSTGYVYDSRMLDHWPTIEPDEPEFPHPEQPARISKIYSALRTAMCFKRMRKIATRALEKHEAMLVHSEDHWDKVEAIAMMDEEAIRNSEEYYERLSLYVHKHTPQVAKLSAGGVIETCLAVARGEVRNAFAIVRPPGHHAEPEEHMGFCFFNNVAVATRVVQEMTHLKRILILDWDVHHGNGTQRAFWTDDSVLYISIHRYEGGSFYPCGPFGSMDSCGEGKGRGKSVNIPWPIKGMGDADYLYAFEKIVLPISYEFAPELVIISAGFDAADGDNLGECLVTPAGFAHMTHMLSCLAGGKLAVALEGGYNLDSNASSALAVARVLLGEAPPELPPMVASEEATETVWQVAMQQSKFWKSIHPKALEPREESQTHTRSIPELLKLYRADYLFHTHKMYQIPFVDEQLGARFDGQMVCTKNVYECTGTLVVFMHDLCNLRVELDGKMYCNVQQEKSYLEDATKQLVDWAAGSDNFSLIDLNLNPRPPKQTRLHHGIPRNTDNDIHDLVVYVWDNYIELSEARHVVIICHGPGCRAAMDLLKLREVKRKVRGIIHVVATGLPPRAPQDEMQQWYRQRSLIFVTPNCRVLEEQGKLRKRYGNVRPIDGDSSVRLLSGAMSQIQAFVKEQVDEAESRLATVTNLPQVTDESIG
ncbi:histone deacetylase complex protein [Ramaria rubella]|nr:histone deacetylase complex protein [Ramaria rubella]